MQDFFNYVYWLWQRSTWWGKSYFASMVISVVALFFAEPVRTYLFTAALAIVLTCILILFVQVIVIDSWRNYKKEQQQFIDTLKGK